MGCFLGCFGFNNKKKKKRIKPRNNNNKHPSHPQQNHVSYIPLDSTDATITTHSHSKLIKEKAKEAASLSKIKKKVRFNLNVKAYEPIPNEEEEDEEEDISSYFNKESITTTYPENYRYQNLSDSYEDDEELIFEDEDFNFEDSDEDEDGYSNSDDDEEEEDIIPLKMNNVESSDNEKRYDLSVLSPVENLSQWKAIKAKTATTTTRLKKKPRKENVVINMLEDEQQTSTNLGRVDASLSNWLGSNSMETQRRKG